MTASDESIERAVLRPWRHDSERRAWVRDLPQPAAPDVALSGLCVATWNVWFGEHEQTARWTGLLAEVEAHDPDVVAFQEAVPGFLELLAQHPWVQRTYAVSDLGGVTLLAGYGVVLMVRRTLPARFELHGMPTRMGRCLLTAVVDAGDHELCVGTTHLESMAEGRAARAQQIALAAARLGELAADVLWLGDMNIGAGWDENASFPASFVDVWPSLRTSPGFTMSRDNGMLQAMGGDRWPPVRFDRVFVRSSRWRATAIEHLGKEPLPDDANTWPSDHFGLVATLERSAF